MVLRESLAKAAGFVSRQQKPFKINLVRSTIQNFSSSLSQQYQSIYTVALGATPLQLGMVNSIGGIASAIVSTPMGWLTGKYGIRKMYLAATPLWILSALMFAWAQDWVTVIPALFLATLSTRMTLTACSMVCGSYLKSEDRATGMQFCDTISAMPRLFAPMIAAFLISSFGGLNANGIRPLYYLQAAGVVVTLALVIRWFYDPLRGGTASARSMGFRDGLRQVFREGTRIKTWTLYVVLSTIDMTMSGTYLTVFAQQYRGADQFVLGSMASVSTVVPLLLSLLVGRLADTVGRKKTIMLLTPLYVLSYILLLIADSPFLLLLSGLFQGFAMLVFITENAIAAELMPLQLLGSWYGLLGLFRGLASVAGPLLGGFIWSSLNPSALFYLLIVVWAVKIMLLTTMPETLRKG
jgi:MFS family permease